MRSEFVQITTKSNGMRNGFSESPGVVRFNATMLKVLEREGYKYIQIKGLSTDKRGDYLSPQLLLLKPLKELPVDQREKEIYEALPSTILEQWAEESDDRFKIFITQY
ncbi:MAG TPA: hypothetical protein VLC28_03100 [Flavitalea sp.]|nr:hypothetical protein [Flavitalea sp.]